MRTWLAETIYWIAFFIIKQITFPHFWISFGGKLIFYFSYYFVTKILQEVYSLVYLLILFIPTGHQKLTLNKVWKGIFSGSGCWPKYDAGFGKTWDILTGNGILRLPGKRDSQKFKHGMLDFFFACVLRIREIIRLNGKCESNRRASSVVSFQTKLWLVFYFVLYIIFGNKRGIRESGEKIAGCGIFVKKEREWGIRVRVSKGPVTLRARRQIIFKFNFSLFIKTCWIVVQFVAHLLVNFASLTVSFSKLLELWSWMQTWQT